MLFKNYKLIHEWVLFVFVAGLLLFAGCDNSSQTSADRSANIGTPDCPLCGEWETPDGITKLTISLGKIQIKTESRDLGKKCIVTYNQWEAKGDREGVILPKGFSFKCNFKFDDKEFEPKERKRIYYHLRNYTLTLDEGYFNESLYIRSRVKIPEQPNNPLIGKWASLKPGENPEKYKDKRRAARMMWFQKDRINNPIGTCPSTSFLKRYIIEDDRVVMLHKNGRWTAVYLLDQNSILLPGRITKHWGNYDDLEFTRIE